MKEKKENTRMPKDKVQVMKGDEVPQTPANLETLLMEEHIDAIPWIPYHPTLWISQEIW